MKVTHEFSKVDSEIVDDIVTHEFSVSHLDSNGEIVRIVNEMVFEFPTIVGGTGFPYVHTQSSPSSSWVVNHNLGYRPVIEVLSPGGIVVNCDVIHISNNQTQVNFNTPQTGTVTAR